MEIGGKWCIIGRDVCGPVLYNSDVFGERIGVIGNFLDYLGIFLNMENRKK